mgnify:FL=1
MALCEPAAALAALCARIRAAASPGEAAPVCGEGDPRAALMLVGEAPGEEEARQGRPFVGRAGRLLDQALAVSGIPRAALWITNVVKVRPVTRSDRGVRNRAPTAKEVRFWLPYLEEEIALVRPRAILCLGATAARALLGREITLARDRGRWQAGADGAAIGVTYHPAYLLRLRAVDPAAYARATAELTADLAAAWAIAKGAAPPATATSPESPP